MRKSHRGIRIGLVAALALAGAPLFPAQQAGAAASSGTWHGISYSIDASGAAVFHAGTLEGDFAEDDQFCEHEGLKDATSLRADGPIVLPADSSCLFQDSANLRSIDLEYFDTTQVTDMDFMFSGCSSLASIEFSEFDTSQATTMEGLFSDCSALSELELGSFDTTSATDMTDLFSGCTKLAYLDLESFDTSLVTEMSDAFEDCDALATVSLGEDFSFSGAGSSRLCSLPSTGSLGATWTSTAGTSYTASKVPDRVETSYSRLGQPVADQSRAGLDKLLAKKSVPLVIGSSGTSYTLKTKAASVNRKKRTIRATLQRATGSTKMTALSKKKRKGKLTIPGTAVYRDYRLVYYAIAPKAFWGLKDASICDISAHVEKIGRYAFGKSSVTKLVLRTRRYRARNVKKCLGKSKVSKLHLVIGGKKQTRAKVQKNYRKVFSKKNVGRKAKFV